MREERINICQIVKEGRKLTNIPVQMSKMHHVTQTICGITAILEWALSNCQIAWCSDETFLVETEYLCLQLISTHAPLSVMLPHPTVSLENKRDTTGTQEWFARQKKCNNYANVIIAFCREVHCCGLSSKQLNFRQKKLVLSEHLLVA